MNTENEPSERPDMLICIVDDQPIEITVLRSFIEQELKLDREYEVVTFTDPREALDYMIDNVPDVAFVDSIMPHIFGVELVQQLRNNPKTAHIKIVMLTPVSLPDHLLGLFDGYFLPPYPASEILTLLEYLLMSESDHPSN